MNIYQIENSRKGTIDWVAAKSITAAVAFYSDHIGRAPRGFKLKRIPRTKWSKMFIVDRSKKKPDDICINDDRSFYCGYQIIQSFAEAIKKVNEPCIINSYYGDK